MAQYRRLTAANYAALVRRAMDIDATTQPSRTVVTDDDEAMLMLAADAAAPEDDGAETNVAARPATTAETALALLPAASPVPQATRGVPPTGPHSVSRRSVDVGTPYGVVDVDVGHALAGAQVTVPNSVWEPNASGRVRCTVVGMAVVACVADGQRIFVLRCPDAHMYAFASGVLAALLPNRLAKYLPARRTQRPRQAVTTSSRTTSAVAAARRLRAPRRDSRRSTTA